MSTCPSCGLETPEGATCIVCGHAPSGADTAADDVAADTVEEPEAVDAPELAEEASAGMGSDRGDEVGAASGPSEQPVVATPAMVGAASTRTGEPGGGAGSGTTDGPPPDTAPPGTPPPGDPGTPPGTPGMPPPAPPMAGTQPVPAQPGALPVTESERNWGMVTHLASLVAAGFAGLSFLGPLVVWLIKKDESRFVRHHAVEALNFNLSLMIYAVLAIMVGITVVGLVVAIPAAVVGFILWFVCSIVAAVKAQRGEGYRYPLTIRLIRE